MNGALLIRGGRVIDPASGLDAVADVLIRDGIVSAIGPGIEAEGVPVLEAVGLVVCPGLVDLHCHLREPGFEHKETIATGARAAARGGFTTICAMPNTEPPLDSAAAVEYVLSKARAVTAVRILPIGCVSKGRRGQELAELAELAAAGVAAFSDDGDPVANSALMMRALEYSRSLNLPIIDHCEDKSLSAGGVMHEGWVATRLGLKGIPSAGEEAMVARDIALARETGGRVHIAHISTAGSVELVRRAKAEGLAVTAEVTPHHLVLTHDLVMGDGPGLAYDTNAKMNPPLRSPEDVAACVQGLAEGIIDAVATDHAPHAPEDKLCEFDLAAFGISGLETALGLCLTLVHQGRLSLPSLVERMTAGPARALGLDRDIPGLGTLSVGAPGDLAIFDPAEEWTVDPGSFASRGKNTPLAGWVLKGRITATVINGNVIFPEAFLR